MLSKQLRLLMLEKPQLSSNGWKLGDQPLSQYKKILNIKLDNSVKKGVFNVLFIVLVK